MALLCRQGNNTISCTKVPIVFVPGVMGSRLEFLQIGERWNPDDRRLFVGDMWHWVNISSSQARSEMDFRRNAQVMTNRCAVPLGRMEVNRGWEGVAWGFYGDFLRYLTNAIRGNVQCPVYAVGYDWRKDNWVSAQHLNARINAILSRESVDRVIIITHSMGGLVTRAALRQFADLNQKVAAVIHVFQPVLGAVVAYRRMFTGAVDETVDGDFPLRAILGTNWFNYVELQSVLPGPVQLLPTNAYRRNLRTLRIEWLHSEPMLTSANWAGDVYNVYSNPDSPPGLIPHRYFDTTYGMTIKNDLLNRIREADLFHRQLGDYMHTQTWALYGAGLMTDGDVLFRDQTSLEGFSYAVGVSGCSHVRSMECELRLRTDGDGTVPAASAAALFPGQAHRPSEAPSLTTRQYELRGVNHAGAFQSTPVRDLIMNILNYIFYAPDNI